MGFVVELGVGVKFEVGVEWIYALTVGTIPPGLSAREHAYPIG